MLDDTTLGPGFRWDDGLSEGGGYHHRRRSSERRNPAAYVAIT